MNNTLNNRQLLKYVFVIFKHKTIHAYIRIYTNKTEINLHILGMHCKLKIKPCNWYNMKHKTAASYGFIHTYVRRILLY